MGSQAAPDLYRLLLGVQRLGASAGTLDRTRDARPRMPRGLAAEQPEPPADTDMIPLTCQEIAHLPTAILFNRDHPNTHRWAWSAWRRRRRARTHHYQQQTRFI